MYSIRPFLYVRFLILNSNQFNAFFFFQQNAGVEDIKIKLIDFQLAYVSSPVNDLSHIFYSGASKTEMAKLNEYLEVYYSSFASFVEELGADPLKIYPFEALKADWKKYASRGLIMGELIDL